MIEFRPPKNCTAYQRHLFFFLRDLPFVANLSKLYDDDTLNSIYDNDSLQSRKNEYSNTNAHEIVKDTPQRTDSKKPQNFDNSFDFNGINGEKALADKNGVKVDKSPNKYKCLDDEVFEDMQRQMHMTNHLKGKTIEEMIDEDLDRLITPEHKKSIKKIEELLDD